MSAADTLYPFEDAAERAGEVLAGNRALTLTALNGGISPAAPIGVIPMTGSGITTRLFVTPIGHSVTFPAGTVANPTVIGNQAVISPRNQARGDLTTEVLLAVGHPNDPGSDVFFDRDENPVSGQIPRKVTCIGAINVETLLSSAALNLIRESGGWSAVKVRSPGPLATLSSASPPTATRTSSTNQATVFKLEFSADGAFLGGTTHSSFNNGLWLRSGIRESILPATVPGVVTPQLLIREVPDDRQQSVDVGEDFVGDLFNVVR